MDAKLHAIKDMVREVIQRDDHIIDIYWADAYPAGSMIVVRQNDVNTVMSWIGNQMLDGIIDHISTSKIKVVASDRGF